MPSHHRPKAFKDFVAQNPDLHRFSQEPEITTIYVMRDNFIEKTLKKVSESGPGPRIVFICIGSNDLRDNPTSETINDLLVSVLDFKVKTPTIGLEFTIRRRQGKDHIACLRREAI